MRKSRPRYTNVRLANPFRNQLNDFSSTTDRLEHQAIGVDQHDLLILPQAPDELHLLEHLVCSRRNGGLVPIIG